MTTTDAHGPITSGDLFARPDLGRELTPPPTPVEQCIVRGAISRPDPGIEPGLGAERGHPVLPIALPSAINAYLLGFIAPGGRANMHRHTYESVLVILEGRGHSLIEGQRLDWEAGDAIFTPRWAWHTHINDGDTTVRYLSITNMPQLANMGLMIREEPRANR